MPSFLEESEDACSGYGSTSRARRGVTEFTEEPKSPPGNGRGFSWARRIYQSIESTESLRQGRGLGIRSTGVGIRAHGSMYIMARGEGPVLHRKKRMTWR